MKQKRKASFSTLLFFLPIIIFLLPGPALAAWGPDSFNPNPQNGVTSIALQSDGKILINDNIYGWDRHRISRLNSDGTLDIPFNPDMHGTVYTIVIQSDGKILIGGLLTSVGLVPVQGVARLNNDGTLDTTFNPQLSGTVYSIAIQSDGKILIGGVFDNINGVARNYIARLNSDRRKDTYRWIFRFHWDETQFG